MGNGRDLARDKVAQGFPQNGLLSRQLELAQPVDCVDDVHTLT
jgi:hypothetical protein